MKNKLLLLLAFFILCASQPTFAGFPVKATTESTSTGNIKNLKATPAAGKAYDKMMSYTDNISRALHINNPMHPHHKSGGDTIGILALVFGILSCVAFGWLAGLYFGIPAIILGAIGLSRGERFSLVGLILGAVSLFVTLIAIIFVAALIGAML